LIDLLDKKEDEMKKALELIDNAPDWARELEKSSPKTLEILHRLFLRFKRRTIPSMSGERGIKNIVSESINATEFFAFASQFCHKVKPGFGESALNTQHYPFTGERYEKITFEMLDSNQILEFLNIFKELTVPLDICWIMDNLERGISVRVNSPETSTPFLFDERRIGETNDFLKENGINQPIGKRAKVKLGRIPGRKRYCPFRIVYIQDNDPHFPGGTISLDYSYDTKENGVLKGMVAEGQSIPQDKDVPRDKAAEEEALKKRKQEEEASVKIRAAVDGILVIVAPKSKSKRKHK